jgi:hypothetical protein
MDVVAGVVFRRVSVPPVVERPALVVLVVVDREVGVLEPDHFQPSGVNRVRVERVVVDADRPVVREVVDESAESLAAVLAVRRVVDADPAAERVKLHVVVFTEEPDDPPAELPAAPLEVGLFGHVGRGEIPGPGGVTALAPRAAGLVAAGLLPAGDAAELHDRVVPHPGLARWHEPGRDPLKRVVVIRDVERAVTAAVYYTS